MSDLQAHLDIWEELESLREGYDDLLPMFARIGEIPAVKQAANKLHLDLLVAPPERTPPKQHRDKQPPSKKDFKVQLSSYYESLFYRIEVLLHQPWIPETSKLVTAMHDEILHLREALVADPLVGPPLDKLAKMVDHYTNIPPDSKWVDYEQVADAKARLIEVFGFPLIVQKQLQRPELELLPALASEEYKVMLEDKIAKYRTEKWLQNKVFDSRYLALDFDAAWARMKSAANDHEQILDELKLNWPKLSNWVTSEVPYADLIWYLFLAVICTMTLITEWWWISGALIIWLQLSLIVERHHVQLVSKRRQALLQECVRFKYLRDHVNSSLQISTSGVLRQILQYKFRDILSPQGFSLLQTLALAE